MDKRVVFEEEVEFIGEIDYGNLAKKGWSHDGIQGCFNDFSNSALDVQSL